jgi:virulence-associated protein VapD
MSLGVQFIGTLVKVVVVPQWTEHIHWFQMCIEGVLAFNLSSEPDPIEVFMVLLSASRKRVE